MSFKGLSNTRLTIATQVLNGVLASISLIAGARFCGAAVIGQAAMITICLGILADIIDFGRCSWVAREVAAGRIRLQEARWTLKYRTMLLAGVVIILACICLLFLNFSIFMLGLFVYPLLFLQTNYIQQLLFAKEQVKGALLLQLVEKISWLMIFPLEAFIPNGLSLFILPIILGSLVHVGIGNVLLRRIEESNDTLKNGTNTKLYFGIQSLVTDLGMLDTVLVGFFASTSNAGVYNLGARVRSPFLLLFNSLIANLKKSFAEHDIEKTKALIYHERFLIFIFYSSIPVTSIVLYFKGTSIFGNDFTSLNKCLSISVLSVIPQSLLLMGANFLSSAGKEKFISHFSSTFTFANLIFLSFGLIKYDFTALDAAVYFFFATVVGTLVVMYKAVTLWKFLMSSNVKRAFNDH